MNDEQLPPWIETWFDLVLGDLVDNRTPDVRALWLEYVLPAMPQMSGPEFERFLEARGKLLSFKLWRMGVMAALLHFPDLPHDPNASA